ncbi:MAG: tRNA pseudouridine(38-40) synthase TruA [Bacteroidales bacterium]|nr:tRNA pseudouridine(38-40) synthase TruA [Bacteroidales bacterium]MDD2425096.1 tRNA pseudouridine(38-40) synthase TruA [Bacteroidales bacterium]MDD3988599.1 tRNA pseudouridine(38-40) synthase TruA [Bacteroidales bacterium]
MRYYISISFKGTSFRGWQHQATHNSVQDEVERALGLLFGEKIAVTGAGRTDAGVHAINYIAHFDLSTPLSAEDHPRIVYKLNAILSSDIAIDNICQVAPDSHARFDAVNRSYRYFIHTAKEPFLNQFSYYFPYRIDIEQMNKAAKYLTGEHDFTSMAKLHSSAKTNICTVKEAFWSPDSPLSLKATSCPSYENLSGKTYCFNITANRFLRNMVRAIVGSLLEIGRGKENPEWIIEVMEKKNRCAAGSSVPAHPLFLVSVEYPYKLF